MVGPNRRNRFLIALPVLVATFTASACAEESIVQPDMVEAITEWSSCRMGYITPRIDTDIPAAALTDAALASCEHAESKTLAVYRKYWDSEADSVLREHRAGFRESTIRMIESRRTGEPFQSPYYAMGVCLGTNLPADISRPEFDTAFDNSWQACSAEREQLRQLMVEQFGVRADEMMVEYRKAIRNSAEIHTFGQTSE